VGRDGERWRVIGRGGKEQVGRNIEWWEGTGGGGEE